MFFKGGILPQPSVVWSASVSGSHSVEEIFTNNGHNWLAKTNYTGRAFLIHLSHCNLGIAGIRIKNTVNGEYRNRASRKFRVSGLQKGDSRWYEETLVEGEFEDPLAEGASPPELETFYFQEVAQVQILKFDLVSYWGAFGGGLDYFAVITVPGRSCIKFTCISLYRSVRIE